MLFRSLEGTLHRPLDDANCTEGRRNRRMDSRLPRKGCTRPRPQGDVRTQMETPPHSKPLKAKTFSFVTLLLCLPLVEGNVSPHQVHRITWRVFNIETGNTVNETTGIVLSCNLFSYLDGRPVCHSGRKLGPKPSRALPRVWMSTSWVAGKNPGA